MTSTRCVCRSGFVPDVHDLVSEVGVGLAPATTQCPICLFGRKDRPVCNPCELSRIDRRLRGCCGDFVRVVGEPVSSVLCMIEVPGFQLAADRLKEFCDARLETCGRLLLQVF